MNKVFLIGRLTKDPELKFTQGNGIAVTNFSIVVDRNYVGQNGEKEADFLTIVCWRKLSEAATNNLVKGQMVAISGVIQTLKIIQKGMSLNQIQDLFLWKVMMTFLFKLE